MLVFMLLVELLYLMMFIMVKDHPDDCISSTCRLWPSAYSRGAWYYNVELAKEAVKRDGL